MSKEKRKKRKWGYKVIIETDTDFKEKVVSGFLEGFFNDMQIALRNGTTPGHMKVKMLWRNLQSDEIPE